MQFHVNGFKPGDPDVLPAAPGHRRAGDPLPETVDVLIAGSGPAGLCLAAQLARVPQIRTMLVEPKAGPMEKGQADGISVRSMEMFQAFGFAEKVMRESVWINETTFWAPGAQAPLTRVARVQDVPDGTSEMPHVLINQARVHDMFLDVMRHSPTRLEPDYGLKVTDLTIDNSAAEYPSHRHAGAHSAGPRGPDHEAARQLCDRLRRRPLERARSHRRCTARRRGAPGLGRDGRAGRHRLSRLAHEVLRALAGRGHPDGAAARGRAPGAPVRRARQPGRARARRRPRHGRAGHHRQGTAHLPAVRARREGGRLVVDLRDRPPPDRQVRRRARRPGGHPRAARDAGRRRLSHAQPQGRARHERVDGRHLQPRLEAHFGADRPRRPGPVAQLFRRAARRGQGPGGVRPQVGARRRRARRRRPHGRPAARGARVRQQPAFHLRPDHPVRDAVR